MSETRCCTVTKENRPRVWKRWRRREPITSLAQTFPNEILLQIFDAVSRSRVDPTAVGIRPVDTMRSIPLVCKSWYGPGTEILYKLVDFPRVHGVLAFHKSLTSYPHLRKLVKILLFPGRVAKPVPKNLSVIFPRIIELCVELEEVHVMCTLIEDYRYTNGQPSFALPIPVGRHSNLRSLNLVSNQRKWANFPFSPLQFTNLEELSLSGFWVNSAMAGAGQALPSLPNLITFTFSHGGGIAHLDSWLCQCPKLRTARFKNSYWHERINLNNTTTTPLIFQQDTLQSVEFWRMQETPALTWLAGCTGLRELSLNWKLFAAQFKSIPSFVEKLVVVGSARSKPNRELFRSFIGDGSGRTRRGVLKQFTLEMYKRSPWMVENELWLRNLFMEAGIKFTYKQSECRNPLIDVVVPVLQPVLRIGWRGVKKFTSPETVQMLEWECPHISTK